ncbi:SPRY domain-containing protein 3-like [Branchiostoma lanceolatum]|uniref:SPRY domain-containing protein 3-like n=1 Tax=Branchiostoma lanceolatum TaxID=7740 RepID=UPI0034550AB2
MNRDNRFFPAPPVARHLDRDLNIRDDLIGRLLPQARQVVIRRRQAFRERRQARRERYERVQVDGDMLSYHPDEAWRVGVFVSSQPITPDRNYFEIDIIDSGLLSTIAIGLVPLNYRLDHQPGWGVDSVGYHADDGKLYKANGQGRAFGPKGFVGDRLGCGIKFDEEGTHGRPASTVSAFFTHNGKELGTVQVPLPPEGLFPAVGMHSEGEVVRLLLEVEWCQEDDSLMMIDSCEEEWARLHDVRVNGAILEYTGQGKSIVDVGLAQARYPLTPTHHYFEIEIVDPGENCYIAIGLTRKDYPKHRHPGWNKGSIAYHADDGKIFVGSGVGDAFGPRCHTGDIMGCGIIFPRDYNLDSEGESDKSSPDDPQGQPKKKEARNQLEELVDMYGGHDSSSDSDSEDDEWFQHNEENGIQVQVFFTRNGKCLGRRDVRIPKGGFFPTVGMLSSEEKVRVDLRPLTG